MVMITEMLLVITTTSPPMATATASFQRVPGPSSMDVCQALAIVAIPITVFNTTINTPFFQYNYLSTPPSQPTHQYILSIHPLNPLNPPSQSTLLTGNTQATKGTPSSGLSSQGCGGGTSVCATTTSATTSLCSSYSAKLTTTPPSSGPTLGTPTLAPVAASPTASPSFAIVQVPCTLTLVLYYVLQRSIINRSWIP